MERFRPSQQVYEAYTEADFEVWKTLYNRQHELLEQYAAKDFMKALDVIGFVPNKIPDFKEVNARLEGITGWKLTPVPCISPADTFFRLLSEKTFTATCWLRNMEELDYLEEPDMFHDVFGHAPLLTNPDYSIFFKKLGDIGIKHIDNELAILMLQRLYWFTVEFGMVREEGQMKIYGAGIISSHGEAIHAIHENSTKHDFDVEKIMNHPFRTDVIQEEYYVIDSFVQLRDSVEKIEEIIDRT